MRNQIVIVARVVESELLVRDPAESEPREIAHCEEVRVGKKWRGLLGSGRVGDLAEEVLSLLHAPAFDLDEAREVHRLRPEARLLGDGCVELEGAVGIARELMRPPVQVSDLAARFVRLRGRHRFQVLENRTDHFGVERDLGQPPDRAPGVGVRGGKRQQTLQISARRFVRARRSERIAEGVDRGVPEIAVRVVGEARALHEPHQNADHFVASTRSGKLLHLEQAFTERGRRQRFRGLEPALGERAVVSRHGRGAGVGLRRRGRRRARRRRARRLRLRRLGGRRRHRPENRDPERETVSQVAGAHFLALARTRTLRS